MNDLEQVRSVLAHVREVLGNTKRVVENQQRLLRTLEAIIVDLEATIKRLYELPYGYVESELTRIIEEARVRDEERQRRADRPAWQRWLNP
jgi:hypothetical protein